MSPFLAAGAQASSAGEANEEQELVGDFRDKWHLPPRV
jgi:hypothetical protein